MATLFDFDGYRPADKVPCHQHDTTKTERTLLSSSKV
jgi:hypothetical protein